MQGEKHQQSRWRSGLSKAGRAKDTGYVSKLCVLKHRLPIKSFIPNFVAFFVLLVIALSCIRKMSSTVTSAKREFTPAIVSLSTSGEVDIAISIYKLGDVGISSNLIGSLSLTNG